MGYQCYTNQVGAVAETVCGNLQHGTSQTIYPPQQFLTYFAGYTIKWDRAFHLLAVEGGQSSSSTAKSSTVIATDVVGYLHNFKSGAPLCSNNMITICPNLYQDIQGCHNSSSENACYCNTFTAHECPGLCLAGHESNDYLSYVLPACEEVRKNNTGTLKYADGSLISTTLTNWTSVWADYNNLSSTAYLRLLPWSWGIYADLGEIANVTANLARNGRDTSLEHCPTVITALAPFAVVNAVVLVVSLFICKIGGDRGRKGGKWWPVSALLAVAINMLSNVINALLIRRTAGYNHVPLGSLILLWCTRPRLAWLVVLSVWTAKLHSKDWTSRVQTAVTALLAEIMLQVTAAFYFGLTMQHAIVNTFFRARHLDYTPHGTDALIMYSGALAWSVLTGIAFVCGILVFMPVIGIINKGVDAFPKYLKMFLIGAGRCLWVGLQYIVVLLQGLGKLLWIAIKWITSAIREREHPQWAVRAAPQQDERIPMRDIFPFHNIHVAPTRAARNDGIAAGQRPLESPPPYAPVDGNPEADSLHSPAGSALMPAQNNERHAGAGNENLDPLTKFWEEMGFPADMSTPLALLSLLLLGSWMAQWVLWIGFVRMAPDLYCLPKIWSFGCRVDGWQHPRSFARCCTLSRHGQTYPRTCTKPLSNRSLGDNFVDAEHAAPKMEIKREGFKIIESAITPSAVHSPCIPQ